MALRCTSSKPRLPITDERLYGAFVLLRWIEWNGMHSLERISMHDRRVAFSCTPGEPCRRRTSQLPFLHPGQKCFVAHIQSTRGELPVPVCLSQHPEHHFSFRALSSQSADLLQRF